MFATFNVLWKNFPTSIHPARTHDKGGLATEIDDAVEISGQTEIEPFKVAVAFI
jgi:hypothetical protein